MIAKNFLVVSTLLAVLAVTDAFSPLHHHHTATIGRHPVALKQAADAWSGSEASGGGSGSIEQIEFKIHPDGRVEETVRGIKGNNCHKVTEKINKALGEVVASKPTEEMFEQEVDVGQTLYQKDSSGDWEGSSSW